MAVVTVTVRIQRGPRIVSTSGHHDPTAAHRFPQLIFPNDDNPRPIVYLFDAVILSDRLVEHER